MEIGHDGQDSQPCAIKPGQLPGAGEDRNLVVRIVDIDGTQHKSAHGPASFPWSRSRQGWREIARRQERSDQRHDYWLLATQVLAGR